MCQVIDKPSKDQAISEKLYTPGIAEAVDAECNSAIPDVTLKPVAAIVFTRTVTARSPIAH